jgi:hypothetical protein
MESFPTPHAVLPAKAVFHGGGGSRTRETFPTQDWDDLDAPDCFLYVIAAGDEAVKVGIAGDVQARLRDLQTAHYLRLRVVGFCPGGSGLEADVQRHLSPHRIRGEWFRATDEVLGYLDALIASESAKWEALGRSEGALC